jgi:hypothetical protein
MEQPGPERPIPRPDPPLALEMSTCPCRAGDATLLAVVPIPGTRTSLAIVG